LTIFLGGLYYHGAHAVIIAYDVTNRNTFENIERWNDKFDDRDKEGVETVKVLVGCKSDLDDLRQVGQIRKQLEIVFSF
jgi:GTPase SAR1 family protein